MSAPRGNKRDPLLGAALVRLSLERKPGVFVKSGFYLDILDDLGLTDDQVLDYIDDHREELLAKLASRYEG